MAVSVFGLLYLKVLGEEASTVVGLRAYNNSPKFFAASC